jgi:hypothetical protein
MPSTSALQYNDIDMLKHCNTTELLYHYTTVPHNTAMLWDYYASPDNSTSCGLYYKTITIVIDAPSVVKTDA